jgi:hypothetical protein
MKIWQFLLFFPWLLAIENLENHFNFEFLSCNFAFWRHFNDKNADIDAYVYTLMYMSTCMVHVLGGVLSKRDRGTPVQILVHEFVGILLAIVLCLLAINTSLPRIYVLVKRRFSNFNFIFQEFQQLSNKNAKYTLYMCNSNPMVETTNNFTQVGSLILNNCNNYQ